MFIRGAWMNLMQKLSAIGNWPNYEIFSNLLALKNGQNNILKAIFFGQTKTMTDEEIKIFGLIGKREDFTKINRKHDVNRGVSNCENTVLMAKIGKDEK
jgi:hypothetical protein